LDVDDPRFGYLVDGWTVTRVEAATGRVEWTVTVPLEAVASPALPAGDDTGLDVEHGYVLVRGGAGDGYVGAVGSTGTVGPVCARRSASKRFELVPPVGVAVVSNPVEPWVEAHSVSDGRRRWAVRAETFLVRGDVAYASDGGTVSAYQVRSGKRRWSAGPDLFGPNEELGGVRLLGVLDGRVYALSELNERLVVLRATDGRVSWRQQVPRRFASTTSVHRVNSDFVLWRSSYEGRARLVDARTGTVVQTRDIASRFVDTPQTVSFNGRPAIVQPSEGRIDVIGPDQRDNRTIDIPSGLVNVVVTDTVAYVRPLRDDEQAIFGHDLATGQLRWRLDLPTTARYGPVPFDGGFAIPDQSPGRWHLFS
jgi:outer membrane protein assembly factor BamB